MDGEQGTTKRDAETVHWVRREVALGVTPLSAIFGHRTHTLFITLFLCMPLMAARQEGDLVTTVMLQPVSVGAFVGLRVESDTDIGVYGSAAGFESGAGAGLSIRKFWGQSFYALAGAGVGYAAYNPAVPGLVLSLGNEWQLENGIIMGGDWLSVGVIYDSSSHRVEILPIGMLKFIIGRAW